MDTSNCTTSNDQEDQQEMTDCSTSSTSNTDAVCLPLCSDNIDIHQTNSSETTSADQPFVKSCHIGDKNSCSLDCSDASAIQNTNLDGNNLVSNCDRGIDKMDENETEVSDAEKINDIQTKENSGDDKTETEVPSSALSCADETTQSETDVSPTAPDVIVISSDCTSDTVTQMRGGEMRGDDHAEKTVSMNEKHGENGVSQSMRYRDEESSTTSDSSSDESGISDHEDRLRRRRTSGNTKTSKFVAPSLEDIRTRGEIFPEELPAIGELKISVNESVKIVPVGKVSSSVRVLVIIEPDKDLPALDEDTVLFTEDRKPFGKIFEVFGPVASPFYSIRFNSTDEIETKGIKPGDVIYYAPKVKEFTHYVFVEQLKRIKGTDASWENNNEPPDWCKEFSDDEDEKHGGRSQKDSAEDSMDCLPGARKPGRPGKRKPERTEKKHGSRETKVPEKKDNHKPLTSWPPSSPDHHGYRPPPPASPRSFSPFGQQNMYSPRPFVSPSNFNNSNIPRHASQHNQPRGPFPRPEQPNRHQHPSQQHPPLHRPQQRPGGPHSMEQHRPQHLSQHPSQYPPSGPHSMEFRPPFQHPGQPARFNNAEPPRPYEMNQQQPQSRPMEQSWQSNSTFSYPATQHQPPRWSRPPAVANQGNQNTFTQEMRDAGRHSFTPDRCAAPRPPARDVVDTRLMQSWNQGGQNDARQSSFGGGPRFESGPIKPTFNPNPYQFQNGRPPYMGTSN